VLIEKKLAPLSLLTAGGAAWRRWPALLVLLALGLLAWPGAARWAYDDPFITYRYAENLRAGLGFVYNPGLRVLSTTTPAYTLLLAALGWLPGGLPLLSNALGLLAILLSAWALLALLPDDLGPIGGVLVVALMALLPPAYRSLGSEVPLYTLLVLLAVLAAARERPLAAGMLAGLATVMRPDGLLAVLIVAGCFLRDRRGLALALGGAALAAGPWHLFALGYFGSPIPATLAAKRAQLSQIAGSTSFLARLGGLLGAYVANPWYWPAVGLCAYGGVALLRQRRLPALLAWALLYTAAYAALGVSAYHWYLVPLFPPLVWLAGYGLWALGRDLRRWQRWQIWPEALLALVLLAGPVGRSGYALAETLREAPEARAVSYAEVGRWLARETPPDARVGAFEVGIVGYHSGREMIDFAGLIQPEVREAAGASYVDWARTAIERYSPEYVVAPPQTTAALEAEPWFVASYRAREQFRMAGHEAPLVIYARR
jgi:hypothetical protein